MTAYTPAETIVAAWIMALTGVGPSIASGSHTCSGNCALLPIAPNTSRMPISEIALQPSAPPNSGASNRAEFLEEALEEHVYRMIAELFGKEDGYCKGRGGSMHIADYSVGHLGANAIVGGSVAIDQIPALDCVDRAGDPFSVDQRGEARPAGTSSRCDVGAFEVQP